MSEAVTAVLLLAVAVAALLLGVKWWREAEEAAGLRPPRQARRRGRRNGHG